MRQILLSSCLLIAIASLSISSVQAEEFTVVTRLILRDRTIVVSQNSQGELRYSLSDRHGNQIETNITETQLAAEYPDIYDSFRPAIADTEVSPWAGL